MIFPNLRTALTAVRPATANLATPAPSITSITTSGQRAFSSTPTVQTTAVQQVEARYGKLPPYPYGPRLWYKKSNFGLYGHARVRFGNTVSEKNEIKTRRRWYPNIQRRRLWSEALGRFVRVKVTTRVLRSVDKVGGLDEYLLGEKAGRVRELGPGGWALRWRVMRTDAVRERFRLQRIQLGLPQQQSFGSVAAAGGAGQVAAVGTGLPEGIAVVPEEDVGLSEEELQAREAAIDRVLDEDAAREARGEDGGVELEELEEMVEQEKEESGKKQQQRTRW